MKILEVYPESPLFGRVRPGYSLLSINNRKVEDALDFCYKISGEEVRLRFADPRGHILTFTFADIQPGELGLKFDEDKIKVCNNNCIFCFVRQQPRGMRRMLYLRDEDYRLSFTHGNYITLSNVSRAELRRIVRQRLSPLYISVHTTDEELRRYMLSNKKLPPLMPQIKYLVKNRIVLHTQVVLCPGINDGAQLEKTIADLAGFYPQAASLAVVPVGLTRYRDRLPRLRPFNKEKAVAVLDYIEECRERYLTKFGSRFVWPADEFYVLAGRPFPKRYIYEDMPQFENGVGMAREFIATFNRSRHRLKEIKSSKRVLFLTGYSAYPFMRSEIWPFFEEKTDLKLTLKKVSNRFWGRTVTVSGLLTGRDLLEAARKERANFDVLALPPNCLNADNLFLDDMTLNGFTDILGKPVVTGQYNLTNTIIEAVS
ncbi:MAG: DUF512 domain-containing protein [candidate division Zixibacteria bacterium]|nr:DUF512 domain-containing protein [candidate division Zixibacteria bacterium]